MLYFTSDLHFGDELVLKYRRAFADVEQMEKGLVARWNETVTDEDTVIIVGDLFGRGSEPRLDIIREMRGKKILVKGNHDISWLDKADKDELCEVFSEICELYRLEQGGVKIFFCHYPMISWEGSKLGSLLVCGHMHARPDGYEHDMFMSVPLALNSGVDLNGFAPVTMSKLIENNDAFYGRQRSELERETLSKAAEILG